MLTRPSPDRTPLLITILVPLGWTKLLPPPPAPPPTLLVPVFCTCVPPPPPPPACPTAGSAEPRRPLAPTSHLKPGGPGRLAAAVPPNPAWFGKAGPPD